MNLEDVIYFCMEKKYCSLDFNNAILAMIYFEKFSIYEL